MIEIVFINAYNLFPLGAHPTRGVKTRADLSMKTADLAATIQVCQNGPPALVGLCEVADLELARRVAERVKPNTYEALWSGRPPNDAEGRPQTGLVILYDRRRLQRTRAGQEQGPSNVAWRTKWMAAEFALAGDSASRFWFVVTHWKSRLGGQRRSEPSRMTSAWEIGSFYLNTARRSSPAMVIAGDFNCEPGEWPFQAQSTLDRSNRFRAVRERPLVLRDRLRLAWFYNPMWRWLAEPELWEQTVAGGPRTRSLGTHCAEPDHDREWSMFDQIMVNRWAMEGRPLRLREGSVQIQPPIGNATDHCAVGATFET